MASPMSNTDFSASTVPLTTAESKPKRKPAAATMAIRRTRPVCDFLPRPPGRCLRPGGVRAPWCPLWLWCLEPTGFGHGDCTPSGGLPPPVITIRKRYCRALDHQACGRECHEGAVSRLRVSRSGLFQRPRTDGSVTLVRSGHTPGHPRSCAPAGRRASLPACRSRLPAPCG